ncbi:hypothetical protein HPB52_003995 [Rhipicephalus sanguineus]|uniref:Peptidase M13 C-terminal domain-containing protein n=1 Tax=Rhipicephalus sanguineus TaxID=34632 RepID=A0A9D4SRE3_RHISA|nr:hypothetical protein HPB52_003995 [Rhipicephalus sanguineus]
MRYNLRSSRVVQFGPRPGSCVWWQGNAQDPPLKRYFDISLMRQQEKLQAILNFSAAAKLRAFESDLDTEVRYDPTRRRVHVPATIFTTSTRTNESFFAFQLPRIATRLYRAMVQMLTEEEPYGEQLQSLVAGLTENSTRALGSLLSCIKRNMPNDLKTNTQEKTRAKAVLEQAVAVHVAFRAFRDMLHVKRIWNLDYRLPGLPEVSSDQLFFIYFALDNCHSEDAVRHGRLTSAAVDELKVGAPLKYLAEFSDAFQCGWQPSCRIAH